MGQAERLAARLHALGVRKGDRVMLDMQNCPQLVIAHFAILRANAVVVPVNPMNRAEELKHYILDPDAKVAIATGDVAAEIAKADAQLPQAQRLQHLVVTQYTDAFDAARPAPRRRPLPGTSGCSRGIRCPRWRPAQVHDWQQALANDLPLPDVQVGTDDLAVLPYTSGTTGLPKGCMHPHRSLMHNAVASAAWGNGTVENVTLQVVPMFHITGMVSVMHSSIYVGATLVLMPRWDRELAGRLISRRKVTTWTNIPTMVIDLMGSPNFEQYDLSSLGHIGGGGAAMPQAVAQRLFDQFGLKYVEGYGLTETAAPSHSNPPDAPKQQCLGIPFMSCDARIVDPETLRELPPGEQGEIVIHGPMVFDGYWKRPEATAAAFIELDGKRFFRSGDLGRMDEDGYFFITDRLKRMINASRLQGVAGRGGGADVPPPRHPGSLRHLHPGCLPRRIGEGGRRAAGHPQGQGRRAGDHRLVPREHGRLQGAAHRAVRRGAAQERQRQGDVAQPAGGRGGGTPRRLKARAAESLGSPPSRGRPLLGPPPSRGRPPALSFPRRRESKAFSPVASAAPPPCRPPTPARTLHRPPPAPACSRGAGIPASAARASA